MEPSPATGEISFQASKELKALFREHFERWKSEHRGGLDDLAKRCGVSATYLGHIARYGRVPGKPVLILLAFNFGLRSPQDLFDAAHIKEPWPYDRKLKLLPSSEQETGFMSLKVDMEGFAEAIRTVVREEIRPRGLRELRRSGPVRVGYNTDQPTFFNLQEGTVNGGLFPELLSTLSIALQSPLLEKPVHYSSFRSRIESGEIDIYGPVFFIPERLTEALYTDPICKIGISALWRKRPASKLEPLPVPKTAQDLRDERYQIAVLRGAVSNYVANTYLRRSDASLILCDTREEALERTAMTGIGRPAHLMIADSVRAMDAHRAHQDDYDLLFATPRTAIAKLDNTIAVRPDMPELVELLNQALAFLKGNNVIQDLFARWLPKESLALIEID